MRADAGEFGSEVAAFSVYDMTGHAAQPLVNSLTLFRISCECDRRVLAQRTNIDDHGVQFCIRKASELGHSPVWDPIPNHRSQRFIVRCPAQHGPAEIGAFSATAFHAMTA